MKANPEFIINCYRELFSVKVIECKPLTQAGSDRKYFRIITENGSLIAVYSENIPETETFLYYSGIFTGLGLNTPEIYNVSDDKRCYFIEDLGDSALLNLLEKERNEKGEFSEYILDLYKKSVSALAEIQIRSAGVLDFSKSYSISEFNEEFILSDLNYFKYYFLNLSGVSYNAKELQKDFNDFASFLTKNSEMYFMFRDFQARNIMIKDDKPYFIDYQGGMKGPLQYDMASLLYQAKAMIPENIKTALFGYYMDEISNYVDIDRSEFTEKFYYFVYLRIMQTLGAYGLRGLIEKRTHFIESIPLALQNLKTLSDSRPLLDRYKELSRVIREVSVLKKFQPIQSDKLTVNITSFSFRKGYPQDNSGNGGGFVFDCRGILNPGRYDEYKQMTGNDADVIRFFKDHTGIDVFLENIIKVVKPTVDNYIEREFKNLSVSFGCTGGQHRSVYCAENFAAYIGNTYKNIEVILVHRELGGEVRWNNGKMLRNK